VPQKPEVKVRQKKQFWMNFYTFGAGQFQNQHTFKAFTLLTLEATGIVLGVVFYAKKVSMRLPEPQYPKGTYNRSNKASKYQNIQIAGMALGGAAALYSLIDGIIFYKQNVYVSYRFDEPKVLLTWRF